MILNPKKELFLWKADAVPYFSHPTVYAITIITRKRFGFGWPKGYFIFSNKGRNSYWYSEMEDVWHEGIKSYQAFWENKRSIRKLRQDYNLDVKNLLKFSQKILPANLQKLSNQKLIAFLEKFLKVYQWFWAIGNMPELAAYGSGYLLEKKIREQYNEPEASTLTRVLSIPTKPSFHLEEQIDLLKLGEAFWKQKDIRNLLLKKSVDKLMEVLDKKYLNWLKKLKKHQKKYFWILNGYWGAKILDEKYFLTELCDLISNASPAQILQKIKQTKEKLNKEKIKAIKKNLPGKKIMELGRAAGHSTAWQDKRKTINLIGNHYLDLFLQEFSHRLEIDKNDLKFLTPLEIIELFNGGKVLVKKIFSRKKMGALEFNEKNVRFVEEKETKEVLNKLSHKDFSEGEIKEIKGLVVSVGEKIIRGKVRILKNASEADKLKPGEILVSVMTSPEYIQAIKKTKAIITDEGSLTCHAAIVSRELGKTCLVSTKIATKVLRDGDYIEVNANDGIVRKIKNNNKKGQI